VAKILPGRPDAQQSFGPEQNTDFSVALVWPVGEIPPGIVGVAAWVHFVPSQYKITGPADDELPA
jgi:hypothetical protein